MILTKEFYALTTLLSLLVNIVVLALAGYTLYLTAFSSKLELVSPSFNSSTFYGEVMGLTLVNKSLHAIPIQKIFILKLHEGNFYYIDFADYHNNPIAVDSWSVKRIDTRPFTGIANWNEKGWIKDYHEIIKDSVIGIESGKDLFWVKPYDKDLRQKAEKAYKSFNYCNLTVYRKVRDDIVLSQFVDCVIYVRLKDINGQYLLKTVFGITGFDHGRSVLLSESICGYNALLTGGNSPETISKAIQDQLGINKENIVVKMIAITGKE